MKKVTIIVFLCLTTISFWGYSQSTNIYGTVLDIENNPLEFVNITIKDTTLGTSSNKNGGYKLELPLNKKLKVIYSSIGYRTDTVDIFLIDETEKEINIFLTSFSDILNIHTIRAEKNRESTNQEIGIEETKTAPTVGSGVEDIIKSQPGVSSNNEMSSQYSVRGGNFDENLVYVNEIEIYRPSLTRSGEQEGLSFVNPDMTEKILFSAGGFDAKYGDKMSSVLDITYKKPTEFKGSVTASLLGGAAHLEGATKSKKVSYLMGTRYRTNKYLLNSLPTKGEYNPVFFDFQSLINYKISKKSNLEFLTNYTINKYNIIPKTSTSTFGTSSETLQLRVFFEGEESNNFETLFGAFKYTYKPDSSLHLKLITSAFNSQESEAFDVLSEYRLDELDPTSGDAIFNKGIGSFRRHARNDLSVAVFNIAHRGQKIRIKNKTEWEVKYQRELITDNIDQWQLVDSAGYTIPQGNSNQIILQNSANADNSLNTNRITSFVQQNWNFNKNYTLSAGIRTNYWDFTNEFLVAPRTTLAYKTNWKKDYLFRFSTGIYYQPPFYKELKNLNGTVNSNVKAQKSVHFVLGTDYNFKAWGNRPFKFLGEIYYKQLSNLIPYQIDNVQVRYLPNQISNGYTAGFDMKINGEFVKGIESWASLSVLSSKEDIENDSYINTNGNTVEPGFIARPTDQRFTFSIFFQDYLPANPSYKVHLNLVYGSGLPFGPANSNRYEDTFRMPSYRRVDIGFSKQLKAEGDSKPKLLKHFTSSWLSFEVFNLLQTNNTISYLWIKDFENRSYAVPNFLTSRRLNLKLILEF